MLHKPSHAAAALGTAIGGGLLLMFSSQALQGVRQGLALCGQTLIPSLFPFMVLALFVGRSGAAVFLGRITAPLCRRWLRLPADFGPVLLMSLIGGYPVGARMLSGLLRSGRVTAADTQRFLEFSVCPAPSFAIVAVGVGVLGSPGAGAVLYGCHVFTGLLIGGWQARRCKTPKHDPTPPPKPEPLAAALVGATSAAVETMLSICGFVLLFSVLLALLQLPWGLPALARFIERVSGAAVPAKAVTAALCGLAEVTCGIFACQNLGWGFLCVLVPFLVSFGSLSVLCQLSACLQGQPIAMGRLIAARLGHALLSALMAAPLLYRMQPALNVMAEAAHPIGRPQTVLSTVALLGMCSLFLLSLQKSTPPLGQAEKQ